MDSINIKQKFTFNINNSIAERLISNCLIFWKITPKTIRIHYAYHIIKKPTMDLFFNSSPHWYKYFTKY